jgi:serine/threonine-protein kinase
MFLDEARISARIYHPNSIAVYDVGEERGRYYLAAEYVRGETLAHVVNRAWKGGPGFPVPLAAHLFAGALDALDVAHELRDADGNHLGVIHRDLSLKNLLLGYDGLLRVLDFGVARAHDHSTKTQPGVQKGTVAYMAPEQIMNHPLDRRVDLFAIGIVLWEVTVGKRLFLGQNDLATAAKIRQTFVPPPSDIVEEYPERMERILLKALSRDPDDRHQSARELAADLRECLAELRPETTATDGQLWMAKLCAPRLEKRKQMEARAISRVGVTGDTHSQESEDGAFGLHVSAGLPEHTISEAERATQRVDPDPRDLRDMMHTTAVSEAQTAPQDAAAAAVLEPPTIHAESFLGAVTAETEREGPPSSKSIPLVVPSRSTLPLPPPVDADKTAPPTRLSTLGGLPRAVPRDPSQPTIDDRPEPLSMEDLFEPDDLDPGLEPSQPLDPAMPLSEIAETLYPDHTPQALPLDELAASLPLTDPPRKPQRAISTAVVYRNPPERQEFSDVTGPPPSKSVQVFDPGPSLLDQPIWTPPPMPAVTSRRKQWIVLLILISVAAVLAALALKRIVGQPSSKAPDPKPSIFGSSDPQAGRGPT